MKPEFLFLKVKTINPETRELDAVASTADKDRDGEIILPSAFRTSLASFMANPVILATHQHRLASGSSPVIGSAIPESITIDNNEVTFRMRFATTPLGEEYWQLYKDGHMRAFSIGFIPEKWTDAKDDQSRYGSLRTYTQIELLEISAVPVPSNRRALARAKGFDDDADIKSALELIEELKTQNADLKSYIESQFDDIKNLLIPNSKGLAEELLLGGDDDTDLSQGNKSPSEQTILNQILTLIQNGKEQPNG